MAASTTATAMGTTVYVAAMVHLHGAVRSMQRLRLASRDGVGVS